MRRSVTSSYRFSIREMGIVQAVNGKTFAVWMHTVLDEGEIVAAFRDICEAENWMEQHDKTGSAR